MIEQWKQISGFLDYSISNHGQVARTTAIPPSRKQGGRGWYTGILTLKWAGRDKQYAQVVLRKAGKSYYRYVHILVAQAFIPNPQNLPTVNHQNGIKWINFVDNLEWATYSDQTQHGLIHGLIMRSPHTGRFVQKAG